MEAMAIKLTRQVISDRRCDGIMANLLGSLRVGGNASLLDDVGGPIEALWVVDTGEDYIRFIVVAGESLLEIICEGADYDVDPA